MAEKPKPDEEEDIVLMGPDLGGERYPMLRQTASGIQARIVKPVKEGEVLPEDAFSIEHRGPGPIYNAKPVFDKNSRSRPATAGYRKGWDRVFGGKTPVGQA